MIFLQGSLASSLKEILCRIDDPVFLVDRHRTVFFHNAAAARVLKTGADLSIRDNRFAFSMPTCNAWLEQMLADCRDPPAGKQRACRGFRLSHRNASRDCFVMFSALPSTSSLQGREFFVVHVISRMYPRELPVAALHDLFGLSRKEMDLLARLVRNETLREIAARMMLSRETIRASLKGILRKCDVGSQMELLALLQKISLLA